jgi:hypothetical protein
MSAATATAAAASEAASVSKRVLGGFYFFAFGDHGYRCRELEQLAECLVKLSGASLLSRQLPPQPPSFIALLGDTFYPQGISSVTDPMIPPVLEVFTPLRAPAKVVVGNHCLMAMSTAHVQLSASEDDRFNPALQLAEEDVAKLVALGHKFPTRVPRLWQSFGDDGIPSRNYTFSRSVGPLLTVDFFVVDTNAAQFSARRDDPGIEQRFRDYVPKTLVPQLAASKATFKVVMCHQPMYTRGLKHGVVAACLRDAKYTTLKGEVCDGFAFEETLVAGGVDFLLSGHEHVNQCRNAHGIQHCCCGSPVELGLYGGANERNAMDWVEKEHHAFMLCKAYVEERPSLVAEGEKMLEAVLRVEWRAADHYCTLLHHVEKRKILASSSCNKKDPAEGNEFA